MIVFLNGRYLREHEAKISVLDPGFLYGDGIFETLRTYGGRVWHADLHLERLYESARMRGWKLPWKKEQIGFWIARTLEKNNFRPLKKDEKKVPEARIRVSVSKGVDEPTIFIWVQPLPEPPRSWYEKGVSVITFPLERPFPQMKTTSMQPLLVARVEMQKKGAFEALLMNYNGNITEGTWTNVYIVKRKTIITPKHGVLLGTTREVLLKVARKLFHVDLRDISRREVMAADECFLTNAPKGIIPVSHVDGKKIGNGKPGPITRELKRLFDEHVHTQITPR